MSDKDPEISGFCAVITNPNGSVVTTATNCERSGFGGFTLEESQKIMLRRTIVLEFARSHLNQWLGEAMDSSTADDLWNVAERAGYKIQIVPIGKAAEKAAD